MINTIEILYIDDQKDKFISRYMEENYCQKLYKLNSETLTKQYRELLFDNSQDYNMLLSNELIKNANIIIIDNRLFEENTVINKYSGIEIQIILKKIYPFKEVIVITQNSEKEEYGIIKKYLSKDNKDSDVYYSENLAPILDSAIKNILKFENIAEKISDNGKIDKNLIEKISLSLSGNDEYDSLTKSDIDNLISTFKLLMDNMENEK